MRTYQKRIIPEQEVEDIAQFHCDICKQATTRFESNWGDDGFYTVNCVTVAHETGTSYPGDYNTETEEFDICPKCFTDRLAPWIAMEATRIEDELKEKEESKCSSK